MSSNSIALLIVSAGIALLPLLTLLWPKMFGAVAVLAMTAAGIYFAIWGGSAFTEITAAIFYIGAFITAVLLALYRYFTQPETD